MITQTTYDLLYFLIVLLSMLIGIAASFTTTHLYGEEWLSAEPDAEYIGCLTKGPHGSTYTDCMTLRAKSPDYQGRLTLYQKALEYQEWSKFPKSIIQIIDFMMAKDAYRFKSTAGTTIYVIGIVFINIIILNLVISLVADTFDKAISQRDAIDLKQKAEMLNEYADFISFFRSPDEVMGNLFILRYISEDRGEDDELTGKMNTLSAQIKKEISNLKKDNNEKIESVKTTFEDKIDTLEDKIDTLEDEIKSVKTTLESKLDDLIALIKADKV